MISTNQFCSNLEKGDIVVTDSPQKGCRLGIFMSLCEDDYGCWCYVNETYSFYSISEISSIEAKAIHICSSCIVSPACEKHLHIMDCYKRKYK